MDCSTISTPKWFANGKNTVLKVQERPELSCAEPPIPKSILDRLLQEDTPRYLQKQNDTQVQQKITEMDIKIIDPQKWMLSDAFQIIKNDASPLFSFRK